MTFLGTPLRTATTCLLFATLSALAACDRGGQSSGTGVVADASAPVVTVPAEAGPVDPLQCAGCAGATASGWTFEGIYRDAACTDPLAQAVVGACAAVPALGQGPLTYVDEVGFRKANETATVTLADVPREAPRFRKTAKGCVRANEAAVAITPASCSGQRVCRDASGGLACTTNCRTLTGGCPEYVESRVYASVDDPGIKGAKPAAAGGNLARLGQCCAQLAAEAKRLGPSPEAGVLAGAAAQCSALVAQAGPNGNAPELGVIRGLLAGRNLPAICAGF